MIFDLVWKMVWIDTILFWTVNLSVIGVGLWLVGKSIPLLDNTRILINKTILDCISAYKAWKQAQVDIQRMPHQAQLAEQEQRIRLEKMREFGRVMIENNRLRLRAGLPTFVPEEHDIELAEEEEG